MITKNELGFLRSLLSKKHRKIENKYLIEGKKSIEEALAFNANVVDIYLTKEFEEKELKWVNGFLNKKAGKLLKFVSKKEIEKFSDAVTPQGIIAVAEKLESEVTIKDTPNFVFLSEINDPGNLGTIIRTCDWFGYNNILLSENCAELHSPKTIRSTMGSIFHINCYEHITVDFIKELANSSGYNLYIADMFGENAMAFTPKQPFILTFCNEANGPGKELLNTAHTKLTIPKTGNAESLNVSAAAAILLSNYSTKI